MLLLELPIAKIIFLGGAAGLAWKIVHHSEQTDGPRDRQGVTRLVDVTGLSPRERL